MTEPRNAHRLQVGVSGRAVATLGRAESPADSVLNYRADVEDTDAVSLTMPVRLESYLWERGLPPVLDMHLPEGALRDELVRRFSKAVRGFDDFDLLSMTGPHQLGRLQITDAQRVSSRMPETSLTELLSQDGTPGLFEALLQTYGEYSGVSGVQPKVLVRDSNAAPTAHGGATHLLKTFNAEQTPELASNEYFCLRAALHSGLEVPNFELSEHGKFLLVERFDCNALGCLGFEDLCALNAWPAKAKYDGSYEGAARQIKAFVSPSLLNTALESFFKRVALSAGVKNGDAHLKNFGVLYPDCAADALISLAPAYDVVTTSVYNRNDSLALLLGGSKAWPKRKALVKFGRVACNLSEGRCNELLQQVVHGMALAMVEMKRYMKFNPGFVEIGTAMLEQWRAGAVLSLVNN